MECSEENQIALRNVLEDFGDLVVRKTSGSPRAGFPKKTKKKKTTTSSGR